MSAEITPVRVGIINMPYTFINGVSTMMSKSGRIIESTNISRMESVAFSSAVKNPLIVISKLSLKPFRFIDLKLGYDNSITSL